MLIVGGGGFIGRHLCARLSATGRRAVSISRSPDNDFLAEHAPLVTPLRLKAFEKDFDAHLRQHDTLIYLASTSIPGTWKAEPWRELDDNVGPMLRLSHMAAAANPAVKFVYTSSGGTVYGRSEAVPFRESTPLAPISSYGYGKVAAEEALRFLGRSVGLRHAILRIANPVGRWQLTPARGIVSVAIQAARSGAPITLFGGGLQTRDFFDADDLADAIIAAADDHRGDGVWNIGSGIGTRVIDVVRMVEQVTGKTIALDMRQERGVDTPYSVLDCTRAKIDLDWSAAIPLRESIIRMMKNP